MKWVSEVEDGKGFRSCLLGSTVLDLGETSWLMLSFPSNSLHFFFAARNCQVDGHSGYLGYWNGNLGLYPVMARTNE
jgi:hypothetical protein